MTTAAALLLTAGLALMIVGAVMAGRAPKEPMTGIAIGMVGVFFVTAGGLFGKFAIAGPYPRNLEDA